MFKGRNLKKSKNTVRIDVDQRESYFVVEKWVDYNNLLVKSTLLNSDILFYNNLQHLFKTDKVLSYMG
mgnify:CR=1 FL=1